MTRGDAAAAIVLGAALAVGGYLLGNVISIGGVTWAGFNFGILLGGFMIIMGLVGLVRGK